jgi:hypothetical protein
VPMLLAGMVLMLIAFFWVPRLPAPSTARRP